MNTEINNLNSYLSKKIGLEIDEKHKQYALKFIKENIKGFNIDFSDTSEQLQNLINKITINETYFFRDKNHIEFIKKLFGQLLEKSQKGLKNSFTIWSLGCSSGEEPYTMAILLDSMGLYNLNNLKIRIYGFDINTNFLDIARRGEYSSWSFRGMDNSFKDYFECYDNDKYLLKENIIKKVNFRRFNIKEDIFSESITDNYGIPDLILCRNILMYFNKADIKKIVNSMADYISADGYIIPGVHELNLFKSEKLTVKHTDNTFVLTKKTAEKENILNHKQINKIKIIKKETVNTSIYIPAIKPEIQKTKPSSINLIKDDLEYDKKLSDILNIIHTEKYLEALEQCNKLLIYRKDDYMLYYIKSYIYFLRKDIYKALDNIEKACFLNSNSALIHYSFSNILLTKKIDQKVLSHLTKALRLVDNEEERFLKITGIKKDELKDCINMTLEYLGAKDE